MELLLVNDQTVEVPDGISADKIAGITKDGGHIVLSETFGNSTMSWALTPCCNASGKGLDDGFGGGMVGCRSCYREVDPIFGADLEARDIIEVKKENS